MSLMCKIFGHKFTSTLWDAAWWSMNGYSSHLKETICKRCGIKLKDIKVKQ